MKRLASTMCVGAALGACALFAGAGWGQDAKPSEQPHVVKSPREIKWGDVPPSLAKGAKIAVMHGDPGKSGPFSVMLKFPPGYRIPAHWHSQDENVVVVSGVFYAGMGDNIDMTKAVALQRGAYVFMPARMHHFAVTRVPTVIELHGNGPFDINYISPADDPQKK